VVAGLDLGKVVRRRAIGDASVPLGPFLPLLLGILIAPGGCDRKPTDIPAIPGGSGPDFLAGIAAKRDAIDHIHKTFVPLCAG
jgi:hypothetical protein